MEIKIPSELKQRMILPRFPNSLHEFRQRFLPDRKLRYLTLNEAIKRSWINRNRPYRLHTIEQLKKQKKTDTLFILGCSSTVNEIPESVWDKIKEYDTFGFNYWIYHRFVPTYYALEYDRRKEIEKHHVELIQNRARDYQETIFMISTRARRRAMHPRLIPESFPENPKIAYFLYPQYFFIDKSVPFEAEHFKSTMVYRGSLNLYLYVARLLGYRRIVLLGCDMISAIPFYEDYPEAQWMHQYEGYIKPRKERETKKYGGFYPKDQRHGFVDAILAINEFVFKPEGIELYVFNETSLLYPKIPLFEFASGAGVK